MVCEREHQRSPTVGEKERERETDIHKGRKNIMRKEKIKKANNSSYFLLPINNCKSF